ncbi:MAG: hypothetical protein ACRCVT_09665 [Leadbetterella sp.]
MIRNLDDTLELKNVYSRFIHSLPKKGSYKTSENSGMIYSKSNFFNFGYSGATKLPFGFYASYSTSYIGTFKIDMGTSFQLNFDNYGFYHLNFQTAKSNIFYNRKKVSDYINYSYQDRMIKIKKTKSKFENHQIKYGINFKKFITFGCGLDYLSLKDISPIGGHLYLDKRFVKHNISASISTSIFENNLNYKSEIYKSINLKHRSFIKSVSLGLSFEEFMSYRDLYFNVQVRF